MRTSAGAQAKSPKLLSGILRAPAPLKLWSALFGLWLVLLSGITGAPGVLQAIRLSTLLQAKQTQIASLRGDVAKLHTEATNLEKNRVVQLREIRRVLGYAAPGELIFDFSSGETL